MKQFTMLLLTGTVLVMSACKKDSASPDGDTPTQTYGMTFIFNHLVGADTLELDTLKYTNAFGNLYRVENLRYLISNITFHKSNGACVELSGYHLVDIHDPSTWEFTPDVKVAAAEFEKITFTMGFDEMDNITAAYVDLNALNWGWPMMLGGGYHNMQLEGKYNDTNGDLQNFATHFGTAREITPSDTIFHPNHFVAEFPSADFHVDAEVHFNINMDINNWYNGPPAWDFNVWNAPIMPIYEAQVAVRNQGHDVYSLGPIEDQH